MSGLEEIGSPLRELRTAFESEVEPWRPALWRYCLRLTGSAWDAEDLVQETMLRAFARLAALWQPVNARAWLFRVATNAWIDQRRRAVRAELSELIDEDPSTEPTVEVTLHAHEALTHMVRTLTPLQRVVFLLCDTLDYQASEAAAMLGTTTGAVKAALHRARAALAAAPSTAAGNARFAAADDVEDVVRRFVAAFDARDPDAIAALLDAGATTVVVGSAEELGRDVARRSSLADWAAEPVAQRAVPGVLDGRNVLFIFSREPGREERIYSLIELEATAATVQRQIIYYYSPELLEYAAAALGVEAFTHGYRFPLPGGATTASELR